MHRGHHNILHLLNLSYLHENYIATGFGEALRSALHSFQEQAAQNLQTIQQSHASGDRTALLEAVHTLKGSAGSVGALRLAEDAERLEQAAAQGDQSTITTLVDEVTRLATDTQSAISILLAQPHNEHWPTYH